jgi:hypothetical protein
MALLAPPCGKSGLALLSALLIGQAAKYLIGSCSDGVWRPRVGKSGLALPSAFLIGQAAKYLIGSCSDGVWRPRVGKSGLALPSARLVSINIVPDVDAPSELGK